MYNHQVEATFEAQQHVTQELAKELSQFLLDTPSEFTSLRYNARYAGTFSQSTIMGVRADGSEGWKGIPRMTSTLGDLTDQLRQAMHRPGTGTWFSIVLTVSREGHASLDFNYDTEPDFGRDLPAHVLVTDQKVFPRDAEHTPEWLARKVDEGLRNPPPTTS